MLRYGEWLLLAPPLVLALVCWRTRAWPSRGLLLGTLAMLAVLAAGLFWYGSGRQVAGAYVPAHLQDGRVVPGHGA